IVATSQDSANAPIVEHVRRLGFGVYAGSETNVLDRYYRAAAELQPDTVVRTTADCPLIDPELVDAVIRLYQSGDVDYASNTDPPSYPDGLDVEVFSFDALRKAWM